ncbi:hypothetical protein BCR32DRAFT_270017 [Anaeromyces robustus]|uniref:Uncharacterized protein n=1 Tax=Anaeromyces robustus TaxID=1754192 RepID=A0A1Y1WYF7_9FUNG|nr:hypothetical protein BCR32DRAFT_270017 [Anaeromyces robustus]|eukprot:ORX78533.1 hypothetical protein BCR32DRAFT_270017 [Anaeromyces robustus]
MADLAYTPEQIKNLVAKNRRYFIEDYSKASFFQILASKGTNIGCYEKYLEGVKYLEPKNEIINIIRIIINAFIKPIQSSFFYWTLLICIIHKFNFRKPVMRIILAHYLLRTTGDIIDQLGNLMNHYFATNKSGECFSDVQYTEQHPLKWFITRQINNFFWYSGEIAGDWYSLYRTIAVARDQPNIKYVYITCGLFNFSKIFICLFHFNLNVKDLYVGAYYNKDNVDKFYNYYWALQVLSMITSLIYEMTVYSVLKKQFSNMNVSKYGFLKKFRTISEYRIIISAFVGFLGLPISIGYIGTKIYLCYVKGEIDLNFEFEDLRSVIINVQYMMIFIDQILLKLSREESQFSSRSESGVSNYGNNNYIFYDNPNYSKDFSKSRTFSRSSNFSSKNMSESYMSLNNLSNNYRINNHYNSTLINKTKKSDNHPYSFLNDEFTTKTRSYGNYYIYN